MVPFLGIFSFCVSLCTTLYPRVGSVSGMVSKAFTSSAIAKPHFFFFYRKHLTWTDWAQSPFKRKHIDVSCNEVPLVTWARSVCEPLSCACHCCLSCTHKKQKNLFPASTCAVFFVFFLVSSIAIIYNIFVVVVFFTFFLIVYGFKPSIWTIKQFSVLANLFTHSQFFCFFSEPIFCYLVIKSSATSLHMRLFWFWYGK